MNFNLGLKLAILGLMIEQAGLLYAERLCRKTCYAINNNSDTHGCKREFETFKSMICFLCDKANTKKANKTPVKTEIFRSEKSIEAIKGYLSLLDELGIN